MSVDRSAPSRPSSRRRCCRLDERCAAGRHAGGRRAGFGELVTQGLAQVNEQLLASRSTCSAWPRAKCRTCTR